MSTVISAASINGKQLVSNRGVCFVMLAGPDEKRSGEVYRTYIKPACEKAGFFARQSNELFTMDMTKGVTNALSCAPMSVAYLGESPWDANVMLQIGYRLSNKLPLVYLRDKQVLGVNDSLPPFIRPEQVVLISTSRGKVDQQAKIQEIVEHIEAADREDENAPEVGTIVELLTRAQNERRYLDSEHAIAWINVRSENTESTNNLIYIAASVMAEDMFGVDGRLVGRTMGDFLRGIKRRMPRAQWAAFRDNQRKARQQLRDRATGAESAPTAIATVPIYFENHEKDEFNGHAFLPVIVKDYQPEDRDWYSIAVLYLDVTNVTTVNQKLNCYECALDPYTQLTLPQLPNDKPVNVFFSYNSKDRDQVELISSAVKEFFWSDVTPWIDHEYLNAGDDWVDKLRAELNAMEAAFVFIGPHDVSEFQQKEIDVIRERQCLMVPVVLPGVKLPRRFSDTQAIFLKSMEELEAAGLNMEDYCEEWLGEIFRTHFRGRVPG